MNVPLIVAKISKSLWKQCKSYSSIKYSLRNSKFTLIENEYKAKVFYTYFESLQMLCMSLKKDTHPTQCVKNRLSLPKTTFFSVGAFFLTL